MNDALLAATVGGYEHNIPEVNLPDPNDRHIVAAGIAAGASIILTWNLRHFPPKELKKFDMRRETPDAFLSHPLRRSPGLNDQLPRNARRNLTKTRVSQPGFIEILSRQNIVGLAKHTKKHVAEF